MTGYLKLMEKYNIIFPIDITTFQYYGGTTDSRRDSENSQLQFMLPIDGDVDNIVEAIRKTFYRQNESNQFVIVRKEKKSWEKDLRPVITVILPIGLGGIRNPAQFKFVTETQYNKFLNPKEED